MVASIEHRQECRGDLVRWDLHKGFLVSRDAELEECDALVVEEFRVLCRVLFEDQSEDGFEAKGLEKGEVFLFGEAAAIEPAVDHCKVVGWD